MSDINMSDMNMPYMNNTGVAGTDGVRMREKNNANIVGIDGARIISRHKTGLQACPFGQVCSPFNIKSAIG